MRGLVLIIVLLIGFLVRGQEVHIKFGYSYSLMYDHSDGDYGIYQNGVEVDIEKLGDTELYKDTYITFLVPLKNSKDKFILNRPLLYSLMWEDLSTIKRNSHYYWDYVKGGGDVSDLETYIDNFLNVGHSDPDAEYWKMKIGIYFEYTVGMVYMIKKSSILKTDSDDSKILDIESMPIYGVGVIPMYCVGSYRLFDEDLEMTYNEESHKNYQQHRLFEIKYELFKDKPLQLRVYKELEKMLIDYPHFMRIPPGKSLNITELESMGYRVQYGITGTDEGNEHYLKSIKAASKVYDDNIYLSNELHPMNVFGDTRYLDFLKMYPRQ